MQVEYIYLEPDGTFPNHEANPLKTETLKDLQAKVLETGADFGFALDGDADRIGLVDEWKWWMPHLSARWSGWKFCEIIRPHMPMICAVVK